MKKLFSIIVIIACAFGFSLNVQAEEATSSTSGVGNIVLGPELKGAADIAVTGYDSGTHMTSVMVTLTLNDELVKGALNQVPGDGATQGLFYIGLTPEKYNNGTLNFRKFNCYAYNGYTDEQANIKAAQDAITTALDKAKVEDVAKYVPTWILAGYTEYNNGTWNDQNVSNPADGKISNKEFLLKSLNLTQEDQLIYGINYRLQMYTVFDWYMVYYVDDANYDIIKVSYEVKYPITGYNEDKSVAIYFPSLDMALKNSKEIDINEDITLSNSLNIPVGTTLNINKNVTVDGSFVIPENTTLNINKDATLTINNGATLTISNGATLAINTSDVTNNGTVDNKGTISGNKVDASALDDIKIPENYESNYPSASVSILSNLQKTIEEKKNLSILYQKEFDEYVTANKATIKKTIEDLVPLANYSELKEVVATAEEKIATGYYKDTTELSNLLNTINYDLSRDQQTTVTGYITSINNAIDALVLKDADYKDVDAAISSLNNIDLNLYTTDSVTNLNNAVNKVKRNLKITNQSEVDQFATDIKTAKEKLVLKPADYSKVDIAKALIPSDLTNYTKVSVKSLNNVLSKNVSGKNILEQSIVDAYANEIKTAIKNLEVLADYSNVDEALNEIPNDMSIYTDDSITLFNKKMNLINIDRDLSTNQQAIIIGYVNAINDAVDCLVEKPGDYSVVEAAIANIPADLSIYTDSSVNVLNNALNNVLKGLTISKQAIIIGYANAINDAVDALAIKATFSADEVNTKDDVKKVTIGVTDINTTENVLKDSFESSEYKDKENISVKLDVTAGNDFKVNTSIANKMSSALEKNIKNSKMISYFDISINLYDNSTGKTIGKLSNLNDPVYLTIALPKEYRTVYSGYTRKYYVLRYHEGLISIINTSLTSDGKGITFRSDKFSTYALAYVDVPTNSTSVTPPYTNDEINSNIILCGVSILGLIGSAIIYKRKKNI